MPRENKGGPKATQKRYKAKNREKINERNRQWYHRNRESQLISRKQYRERNKAHIYSENAKWQRNKRRELFAIIVEGYGGQCNCCGESEILFLEIDHIFNDGNIERKRFRKSPLTFYHWLIEQRFPKDRYQILCSNCNQGKHRGGGICPHKMKS